MPPSEKEILIIQKATMYDLKKILLQEGRYVLDDVYTLFTQDDLDDMKPEERAAVVTEFKCHLFDRRVKKKSSSSRKPPCTTSKRFWNRTRTRPTPSPSWSS